MNPDDTTHAIYIQRINEIFRYIDEHLSEDLPLAKVAEIAHYSPYHFHRIFKYLTSEPLHAYVNRRRLEKSALDLRHKNITITEMAYKYGFGDITSYSRAFKRHFGVSPTNYKSRYRNKVGKKCQVDSKYSQSSTEYQQYLCIIDQLIQWIQMNAKIDIKELPPMHLAYSTCIGVKNIEQAFHSILKWTNANGLMEETTRFVRIFHDSFKVTAPEKVRMSAGVLLSGPAVTEGVISQTTLAGGKCIVGRFEIEPKDFEKAWTGLFIWMSEQGYLKAEKDPFEVYYNDHRTHPEGKAIVDLCIPVK